MKTQITLSEAEMKQALIEFVKKHKSIEAKSVWIGHYDAGGDPRERSYFYAQVSE